MSKPSPELAAALATVLDKIDRLVRADGYQGEPILMFLAGGLAVNYFCGSRYTEDIDASFSRRILFAEAELTAAYRRADGRDAVLYFDGNYNPAFALMHPDFQESSRPWEGIGNEHRMVKLHVLCPVDLAVSKVARLSDQDRKDILDLATGGLVEPESFRRRAVEALEYYVGDKKSVQASIEILAREISGLSPGPAGTIAGDAR